ncbi:MAG: hypothetical protein U0M50_01970 [Paramuribaculum sp.]
MADNYLEKQMEDFRRGVSAPRRSGLLPPKPQAVGLRALVVGGAMPAGVAAVTALRNAGWRVAFTDADIKSGRSLAQTSGAQHHPVDPSDAATLRRSAGLIIKRWGALDLVLCFTPEARDAVGEVMEVLKIPVIYCF